MEEERALVGVSEADFEQTMRNVEFLERILRKQLKEGVDYFADLFPGQKKPVLGDSGASVIINAFRCYASPRVEEHTVEAMPGGERIRYVVKTQIVHRLTGQVVAEGVGSASSDEVKYKYRWVAEDELRDKYGYTDEELDALESKPRRRKESGKWVTIREYRVRNPEILDLDNTILKMAAKRSKVDACLDLPGVSRVFTQDLEERKKPPKMKEVGEIVVEPSVEEEGS